MPDAVDKSQQPDPSDFPTAVVADRSKALFAGSRVWWLALACLILAVSLVIASMPAGGTHVQIHFPQGHGLTAENAVRYRGIDVGVVDSVHLTDDLDAVDVHVQLFPTAKRLAVEGTKFWIVRPKLSISGVSGLETAVGHKYIEVQPGDRNQSPVRNFDGLANAPVDNGDTNGIEILLQADARHSVNVGSAIHFRGVDVGRILSVQLSPDARLVEVRGKVDAAYRSLVTTETKFWATGGVDFDFSLTKGLKLDTESLDTLARGGVSMLVVGDGQAVEPGHAFALAAQPDPSWADAANKYRSTAVNLRGAINLTASWTQSRILGIGKRTRVERFTGVGVKVDDCAVVVYPADVLALEESALDDSFTILRADGQPLLSSSAEEGAVLAISEITDEMGLIAMADEAKDRQPANCVAVRKALDKNVYHHLPIEAVNLKWNQEEPSHFSVQDFTGDRAVWHGTPVLRIADSKMMGILLIDDQGATVVPISHRFAALGANQR